MSTEALKLSAQPSAPASLRAWILWLLVGAAALVALLAGDAAGDTWAWRSTRWLMGDQDTYAWQATKAAHQNDPAAPFYYRLDPPFTATKADGAVTARLYARTLNFWRLLRDMGEPWLIVVLLAVVWLYDRRGWRAAALLLTTTCAIGGLRELMVRTAGRYRPTGLLPTGLRNDGGNYWELFRGFHTNSDLSFPSGHATLAFATAAVLAYLSPRGRWLFWMLAGGCALARVVLQAHFYSDVTAGAILGYALGALIVPRLDRLLSGAQRA